MRRALGGLFGAAARLRLAAYRRGLLRRHRLAGPVVSVGNLSVGGSGKTPVVRRVAELLRDEGRPVAILSRGYGGRFHGDVLFVSDGKDVLAGAAAAGDEPVMLARALPGVVVAVGPRRDVVGRAVEARFGRRVHVLDDGFQHLRLERDLDIVCLDIRDLEDRPLPAGRLREGPEALERAQAVLLTRLEAATAEELRALETRLGPERTFRVSRRVVGWRTLDGADAPAPSRVFLFAGIARPERFETDVRASGGSIAGREFFTDHHRYHRSEIEALASRARATGAEALATTAKDAVRLEGLAPDTSGLPVLVFHVAAAISDEDRFRRQLLGAVERAA
jgi:tetraacyldisaccharide 4'-kinase